MPSPESITNTLHLVETTPTPPVTSSNEKWLDAEAAGLHLGFSAPTIRKLAAAGRIPGHPYGLGKKTIWRFKLSELDAQQPQTVTSVSQTISAAQE